MFKSSLSHLSVVAVLLLASPSFSATDEAALYDAPLPADAIFLRWLDTGAGSVPAPDELTLSHQPEQGQEAYHPLSASHLQGAKPGRYYTIVRGADGAGRVIAEPERGQKSKVHITLLNASPQPVRLVLAGAGHEVIQQTDAFASGGRLVNPVAAKLAVLGDDGQPLGEVAVRLRRGQNVTVLVTENDVRLIENAIGPLLEE